MANAELIRAEQDTSRQLASHLRMQVPAQMYCLSIFSLLKIIPLNFLDNFLYLNNAFEQGDHIFEKLKSLSFPGYF